MGKKYQIVIEVDKPELKEFEDWLEINKQNILAISENDGCGCCVDIFTIEVTESVEISTRLFTEVGEAEHTELYYGDKKDKLLQTFLS